MLMMRIVKLRFLKSENFAHKKESRSKTAYFL